MSQFGFYPYILTRFNDQQFVTQSTPTWSLYSTVIVALLLMGCYPYMAAYTNTHWHQWGGEFLIWAVIIMLALVSVPLYMLHETVTLDFELEQLRIQKGLWCYTFPFEDILSLKLDTQFADRPEGGQGGEADYAPPFAPVDAGGFQATWLKAVLNNGRLCCLMYSSHNRPEYMEELGQKLSRKLHIPFDTLPSMAQSKSMSRS